MLKCLPRFLGICILASCLSGCVGAAILASGVLVGGSVIHDQRTIDEIQQDQAIAQHIANQYQASPLESRMHLNFMVLNHQVLVAGQAPMCVTSELYCA